MDVLLLLYAAIGKMICIFVLSVLFGLCIWLALGLIVFGIHWYFSLPDDGDFRARHRP